MYGVDERSLRPEAFESLADHNRWLQCTLAAHTGPATQLNPLEATP
jgi:hypothetical protein